MSWINALIGHAREWFWEDLFRSTASTAPAKRALIVGCLLLLLSGVFFLTSAGSFDWLLVALPSVLLLVEGVALLLKDRRQRLAISLHVLAAVLGLFYVLIALTIFL